jgi:hypothetical protein
MKCDKPAMFRYTWPGKDESFICLEHAPKIKVVANTIGLHLQLIPVDISNLDERCQQEVSA